VDFASGLIAGLIQLFLLDWLFDWLQERFGFGRERSCAGCGCGVLLLLLFAAIACYIITATDWTRLGLHALTAPF
jgi:predicted PurR-regulated permease PerM